MDRIVSAVRFLRATVAGALVLLTSACGREAVAPQQQPGIAVLSGNQQESREGSRLRDPLAVRVTGPRGMPAAGVEVVWRVIAGAGEFQSVSDEQRVASAASVTDGEGVARVYFLPTVTGRSVVSASAQSVASSPATFYANQRPRFEIVFGPLFDCTPFNDPSTFSLNRSAEMVSDVDASVSVGYTTLLPASCTARVKVRLVADTTQAFDSGLLHPGDALVFTPRIAGAWELTDVINGGSGVLIVR